MNNSEKFAAAFVVLTLACTGEPTTGVVSKGAASIASLSQAAAGEESRPITGQCQSKVVSFELIPNSPLAREVVTGPCQISHLGRVTLYLRQVINLATGVAASEEVTFTAANGDVLRARSTTNGTTTDGNAFSLIGTFTFSGGTGRFAHATGSADFVGSANFATGEAALTMKGNVAYDASDRAD